MTKRQAAQAHTRTIIHKAATDLFTVHGYEAVTVRMIAKRAGYSVGALFSNWESKEALFAEVMGRPYITDAMGHALLATISALRPKWEIDQVLTYAAMGLPTQDGPSR